MERFWRDKTVIPYLIQNGYEILPPNNRGVNNEKLKTHRTKSEGFNHESDLIVTKSGNRFIIELKFYLASNSLSTGIGQLIIHKFLNRNALDRERLFYWLVFPQDLKAAKQLTPQFLNWLYGLGIEVKFI